MSGLSHKSLVVFLWVAVVLPVAAGKPRVATVDASTLFTKYHRTKTEQTKLAEAKLKLQEDPRLAVIKQIGAELKELRGEVRNTNNSDRAREEYFRQFQMKNHELRSLRRDTTQHLELKQKDLNKRLVTMSQALLAEIQAVVETVATAEGYDMVLEKGGDTSSQVPTLIYIRDSTDITALVLKELNKNRPPPGVTPLPPANPAKPAPRPRDSVGPPAALPSQPAQPAVPTPNPGT